MDSNFTPVGDDSLRIYDHLPLGPGQSTQLRDMVLVVGQSGSIAAMVDSVKRTMHPHGVMVMRPGREVKVIAVSDDFDGFIIVANEKRINEMLPSLRLMNYSVQYERSPLIQASEEETAGLFELYRLLSVKLQRKSQGAPYANESLRSLCELIFYDTLSIYACHVQQSAGVTRRERTLNEFMELVERHFQQQRRIEFYAQQLSITSKRLSAAVKEACGHTASDLIALRVMSEARYMLRNSCLNVQEIANLLNFKTQSFFGKYFKSHAGQSPSEFRANEVSD